uniref:Uncharacterized protein n=1 Tax=Triticum urartu TaxID=4572 RepID=A0A8R7VCV2_TRIUA
MAMPSACGISWTSWSGMPRSLGPRMFTAGSWLPIFAHSSVQAVADHR